MSSEAETTNAIIDYLNLRKVLWFRVRNSGQMFRSKDGEFHFGKVKQGHEQKGVPDIIACCNGRFLLIEVKTEVGQMSREQKEFHERWAQEGHGNVFSVLARSVDDVAVAVG